MGRDGLRLHRHLALALAAQLRVRLQAVHAPRRLRGERARAEERLRRRTRHGAVYEAVETQGAMEFYLFTHQLRAPTQED